MLDDGRVDVAFIPLRHLDGDQGPQVRRAFTGSSSGLDPTESSSLPTAVLPVTNCRAGSIASIAAEQGVDLVGEVTEAHAQRLCVGLDLYTFDP